MKRLFNILFITILFSGCASEDFLDQPLKGRQQLDNFFSTEENAITFVNGVYEYVSGNDWWEVNFFRNINEMATDDNWAGNTAQARPDITGIAAYNVFPGSAYFNSFWQYNYVGITRANIALERIAVMENIDEDLRARLLAEAKFLRGWYYFELVKNFGGVPIIKTYTELLTPDFINTVRSTQEETYDFVETNLREAIPDLPLKSEYPQSDMGRATKGAAQSLLAKVLLYRENWSEAQTVAEEVIKSKEYQLEPLFENVWSVDNHHGVESIFEVEYINNENYAGIGAVFPVTNGSRADAGWGWCMPTSDLENAFLSEGDNIRLRSTIIKHGDPVYGDPSVTEFDAKPSENKSGRVNRKFYIPVDKRPDNYTTGTTQLPTIHIRYADLLLIHAEAAYFNNQENVALQSLQQVRNRVQLTTNMSLAGAALRDAIWKERRLELALEQHRLYDLRREKINGVPRIATIMGPNGSFVKYNTEDSTDPYETTNDDVETQEKGVLFDVSKHMIWPIPPEEIQLSQGSITQNPGY